MGWDCIQTCSFARFIQEKKNKTPKSVFVSMSLCLRQLLDYFFLCLPGRTLFGYTYVCVHGF